MSISSTNWVIPVSGRPAFLFCFLSLGSTAVVQPALLWESELNTCPGNTPLQATENTVSDTARSIPEYIVTVNKPGHKHNVKTIPGKYSVLD